MDHSDADLAGQVFDLCGGTAAGKTALLREYACGYAVTHPGAHIAIVMQDWAQAKMHTVHITTLLTGQAIRKRVDQTWELLNGSTIRLVTPGDEHRYRSAEFDLLLIDRADEIPAHQRAFLRTRLRSNRYPAYMIYT